jgi:hypothetical protein
VKPSVYRSFASRAALTAFLLLPLSCGDGSAAPPVPARITVEPDQVTMDAFGLTEQLTAVVRDLRGRPIPDVPVTWVSVHPEVASVSATGLVTSVGRGSALVRATAEGLSDAASILVSPVPAILAKVAGDGQMGTPGQGLSQELELEVLDSQGNGLEGVAVTFSVRSGGGSVSPTYQRTEEGGRVKASWILGCTEGDSQRLGARVESQSVEFSAQVDLSSPTICNPSVPRGRAEMVYEARLEAVGGDLSGRSWGVEDGALPAGVTLSEEGVLAGLPSEVGVFPFRAAIRDGSGNIASGDFHLRICEAPVELEPGGSVSLTPAGPDGCGFFLPSGKEGDRYRLGILWSSSNRYDTIPASVTVSMARLEGADSVAQPGPVRPFPSTVSPDEWPGGFPGGIAEALRVESEAEAFHLRLWQSEREFLRRLGPGAPLLPDRRHRQTAPPRTPEPSPEKLILYPNSGSDCDNNIIQRTALKVAENDYLVIYQDSVQAQVDSLEVNTVMAQRMLDYYRDFGTTTIDTYFGGVTDVNGDGRVVVFVTPVVSSSVVAYVWSGDLRPGEICPASNEMELVRFRASAIRDLLNGEYQPLGTMVHEVKHLSSLYNGMVRYTLSGGTRGYHPRWVEEGTATLAGEISSRLAWAAAGGPAVGAMVRGEDKVVSPESYYAVLSLARGMFYLSSQPNGVVAVPKWASSRHSVYGSGWHFHRWLGDAYGGAADPLADGSLFTLLNDSLSASGPAGIEEATGKSWPELLDEYATAIMLNGMEVPAPPRGITSYHMPEITRNLYSSSIQPPGFYPWPVNVRGEELTAPFVTASYLGQIGPSGIRIFDLTSDGSGLGLEVAVSGAEVPLRLVVTRVR